MAKPPPPPRQKRQNLAAAGLLIGAVAALFLLFAALDVAALGGTLNGQRGVGRIFLLLLDTKIDPKITVAIGGILGVGGSYIAGGGLSDRLFYAIVVISAVAAVLCLLLLVLLSDAQLAQAIYNYGSVRIADADSFRTASTWVLVELALWLLGVVGVQVGVR
jgi:hypothetical protein